MKNNNLKHYIFIFFIIILFIPMIVGKFNFFNKIELHGYIAKKNKDTVITSKTWFNDNYQKKKELFLNESFGYRNFFVKLYNQLRFNLFKKTNAVNVTIAKDNILIQTNYIHSHLGKDIKGD